MANAKKRIGKKGMRMRRRRTPIKIRAQKKVQIARSVNLKSDIHYISRYAPMVDTSTLSTLTSSVGAALLFKLSDVPNSSDFVNLFDSYRLIGVQLTFRLMDNPDSGNYINSTTFTQGANFYPKLWTLIDRDDSTTPTVANIRERAHARCAVLRPDRFIKVFIKYPRPMVPLPGGTAFMNAPKNCWLRTTDTPADHYCVKVVLDKMGYAGNTFTVGIDKKYFFAFKDTK